jgi:type II secretory pathway pseudopilin PulG
VATSTEQRTPNNKVSAFTLVEVLLALAVIVIGLVPLLHLLIVSVLTVSSADCLSEATMIGNAKMAEVVGAGYPDLDTDRGSIESENNNTVFDWQVTVTDAHIDGLEDTDLTGLRKVNVAVTWNEGIGQKGIYFSTYVCAEHIVSEVSTEKTSARRQ